MRIFIKLKTTGERFLGENITNLRTLVLAQKGDEMEALNCNNIWVEVEKKGDEYFPIHCHQSSGFFIPKTQIEDKMILL